jgi:hypothetical protein
MEKVIMVYAALAQTRITKTLPISVLLRCLSTTTLESNFFMEQMFLYVYYC